MSRKSFSYSPPVCPYCGTSSHVAFVWSAANVLRLVVASVVGLFITDLVRIEWKCRKTGRRFRAYSFEQNVVQCGESDSEDSDNRKNA